MRVRQSGDFLLCADHDLPDKHWTMGVFGLAKTMKALPLAAAVAAVVFSAGAAAADVDFFGYARSGIGASGGNGDQVAFQAVGAASKYRLGNETETYSEIGLGSDLFDNGEQSFRFNSRMAFSMDQTKTGKPLPLHSVKSM